MSGEESVKPINIDPQCIQDALRMFLQPIKNDDPRLDFFTMYKRETTEYDTDSMQKHNEDLDTTLIFAGLFSAVSSAFVIDIQSKLESDPTERSEAYLRAILLTLNRSIVPNEVPAPPPVWKGPPAEVITTLDLLYASLLMSLLAAFVAMLGKQWLSRYLRHTGGSMVERCGDRQRKFDGLGKWPFRFFIDCLPVMLQIALLLLACGLSRYIWSINTSVARVVISLTVLGLLFYIGIVAAGASSYECPFQTPVSTGLRYAIESGIVRRLFPSFIHAARKNIREFLRGLSLPSAISLVYATWMDTRQGFVSAPRHFFNILQNQLPREISPSRILSWIRSTARKAGYRTIILLLQIDRAFGNVKQRLVQTIRRFRHPKLLPTTTEDADQQPGPPRKGPGLLVRVRNLEALRGQNTDNARCVCWILRHITDPEAIESAIRLAGTIRWFDGDSDHHPPFDLIVSTFEACFDSAKQLYPSMRDRAYFSARAILQINLGARIRSHEYASKYPIPEVPSRDLILEDSSDTSQQTDPDLYHIIHMLQCNFHSNRPTLDFPKVGANTHNHLLWASNLFVDFTNMEPNPILGSYESYLSAAVNNHRATIANTLLMWYMFLGGRVEGETFWAADKSDSLETILLRLAKRVTKALVDGDGLHNLNFLLEFLAAWEKRPAWMLTVAYEWCSAISEVAGRFGLELKPGLRRPPGLTNGFDLGPRSGLNELRLQLQDLASEYDISEAAEEHFSHIRPDRDLAHTGGTSHHTRFHYGILLSISLEVGFRLVMPRPDQILYLEHTPYHGSVFKAALACHDDEVIADGICVWIGDSDNIPASSCMSYLVRRVERGAPLSPRLRRMSICAIEHMWSNGLSTSEAEIVYLLNCLEVDVDDTGGKRRWRRSLVDLIRSPWGFKSLSIHYWHLLDKLAPFESALRPMDFESRDMELVKSLEEAEDWERLEVWMAFVWQSLVPGYIADAMSAPEVFERVTLKLFLRRPSTLRRFENLCNSETVSKEMGGLLRRICVKARVKPAEQLPSELLQPPQSIHSQSLVPLPFERDDTF